MLTPARPDRFTFSGLLLFHHEIGFFYWLSQVHSYLKKELNLKLALKALHFILMNNSNKHSDSANDLRNSVRNEHKRSLLLSVHVSELKN